jgi:hypothetical protein
MLKKNKAIFLALFFTIFCILVGSFLLKGPKALILDEIQKHIDSVNIENNDLGSAVYRDDFSSGKYLEETGSLEENTSNNFWWLNSGAYFISEEGITKTIQGDLEKEDEWRKLYSKNNPRDTDNGFHPQNIFRLVTRNLWMDLQQEAYFRIVKDNKSASEYRNDSNGLLFFNRYQDGNNLYYTGIRVDGYAVIKKKIKGKYFTMAYSKIFPGKYDREANINLLPHDVWIGLRSEVVNEDDGSVRIKLFLDKEKNGNWELIAEAKDDGKKYGGESILKSGHAGIRTDFMDVEFDDYKIEELK